MTFDELALWIGYAVLVSCGVLAASAIVLTAVYFFNRAMWRLLDAYGGIRVFQDFANWVRDQRKDGKT